MRAAALIGRVAVAVLGLGASALALRVASAAWAEAGLIERAALVEARALAISAAPPVPRRLYPCGGDGGRAALTLALSALDGTGSGALDLNAADQARARALTATEALLRCVPTDGNAWLRRGLLSLALTGPAPETMAAFDLADRFARAEPWVVRARLPFYADLAERGVPGFAARAQRDLAMALHSRSWVGRATDWAAAWPNTLAATLQSAVASLETDDRRAYDAMMKGRAKADVALRGAEVLRDPFSGAPIRLKSIAPPGAQDTQ